MSGRPEPTPRASGNADWIRALQRTADITPGATRTLARVVDENGSIHAERPALLGEPGTLTHAALAALSNRVSRWGLARGLGPGDHVALMMENQPAYPAVWIGLSRIGVVTALVNARLVGAGLLHCLTVAAPRHVIVDPACRDAVCAAFGEATPISVFGDHAGSSCRLNLEDYASAPLAESEAPPVVLRDAALLIYTSGTTGLPKAARVSHYRIMMWSEWFAGIMDARPDDRLYDCLPMSHSVGGIVAVGAMLAAGGSIVVRRGFSASGFWDDVVASEATIFQYIGELCRYLVNAPADASVRGHKLRLCCGNGLRADVWEGFAERFAVPRIIEFYAATEGSFSLFNLDGRPGAIGRIPGFMAHRSPVAIVRFDVEAGRPMRDGDEFCLRCALGEAGEAIGLVTDADGLATRFEGYTNEAESDRKLLRNVFKPGDAWFRTGDLMRRDADGFFYFVDRIGDTFRWKGENVATSEVAEILCGCPGVLEANVYGVAVPHADGRAGMAALVVDATFDAARLRAHAATHLPRYARPLFLRLRAALTMTDTFKVRKSDDMREGFDPALVSDPLFVDDGDTYRPLDADTHAAIVGGRLRL